MLEPDKVEKLLERHAIEAAKQLATGEALMERRLGDPQMRTVGYDPNALRPDRVNGGDIKRLGPVKKWGCSR